MSGYCTPILDTTPQGPGFWDSVLLVTTLGGLRDATKHVSPRIETRDLTRRPLGHGRGAKI